MFSFSGFNQRIVWAVSILLLGTVVSLGVFAFFAYGQSFDNFNKKEHISLNWTEPAGFGVSVPACSSASAVTTCSGTNAIATAGWTEGGHSCLYAVATLSPGGFSSGSKGCNDSYTFTGLAVNTTYTLSIDFHRDIIVCDVIDPEGGGCLGSHIEDIVVDSNSSTITTPLSCAPPPPLTASCSVSPTSAIIGQNVDWSSTASGGTGGGTSSSISQSFSSGNLATWMNSASDSTISARRFQASSSYLLKRVSLPLARSSGTNGRIWVTIEADSGGLPSGSTLVGGASQTVNVSLVCTWGACATWIDFNFPGVDLISGTNYWIVFHGLFTGVPNDGAGNYAILNWQGAPLDSNAGAKSLFRSYTSTSVWTDSHLVWGTDLWYRTYAGTSPYSYSWSGTDGLSGTTQSVVKSYSSSGTKTGSVNVTSGTESTGPISCSNSVSVANSLPGDFTLSVGSGLACNSVPLSWTASVGASGYRILKGAARVDITPYNPYTALNFTDTSVSENTSYLYQIEAYNGAGTNRSNVKTVTTPFCPPTLSFSGTPTTIFQTGSTVLTWSTGFTTSCTASGAWSGSKPTSGSQTVFPSPPPSATFTLTCTGPGGSTGPQSVVITIVPLALPEFKEIIPR